MADTDTPPTTDTPTPIDATDTTADFIPPKVRTYIYGLLQPVSALVTAYGIVDDVKAALWVGLAASLLGTGTAIAYRPTR
jgi:hypothetical protein